MTNPSDTDLQRIKKALRKGAIDRNAKTALALGAAMSGAIISLPALAVTTTGALAGLCLMNYRKQKRDEAAKKLNIIPENDF